VNLFTNSAKIANIEKIRQLSNALGVLRKDFWYVAQQINRQSKYPAKQSILCEKLP